jgi:hypothetical protein
VAAVARSMEEREEFLADIHYRLEQAQATQKKHYDKSHRPVSYQIGDWVLLRLRQCAPASLPQAITGKLKPRYFGPYRVTELINAVALRLALPPRARLHDVFHVGLLKKWHGTPPDTPLCCPACIMEWWSMSLSESSSLAWPTGCARFWFNGRGPL